MAMPSPSPEIFASPDSNAQTVQDPGESALIERLRDWLGEVSPPAPAGMGDDCSVLDVPLGKKQLLTTDSVTYGQHFDNAVSPANAGRKLIKRNLSDIAAMGGEPGPALLNLLMAPNLSIRWLEAFIGGVRESCERYGVRIVGGDVSQLDRDQFSAALTLVGFSDHAPALRKGANVGDWVYVTGTLGGSILEKHYDFSPRLAEGRWLARQDILTAMMDLTDGLGKDLAALLPHDGSAEIELARLPISESAEVCSQKDGKSAEDHAFCDGEDYELLFTVKGESDRETLESSWRSEFPELELNRIGRITPRHTAGRYIDAASKEALPWSSGFEHFKDR